MYARRLALPNPAKRSFFIWGPRQVGKTSLLRHTYPNSLRIDLLKSDEFMEFNANPSLLRERILATKTRFVIIDEIQKAPVLLDEVHYLIEEHKTVFALCGSSARKVRRQHANLLGGRALRYELYGLTSVEMGEAFDLQRMLNRGYMPALIDAESDSEAKQLLKSYVGDYLKEEVFAEGLVRKLTPFSRFLESAALGDTELLSYEPIDRDCGVSPPTVKSHYQILSDTLIGSFLPAFLDRPKRRTIESPKFYFSDAGVVNILAKRWPIEPRTPLFGKAFENWVQHELRAYLSYTQSDHELAFWRLTTQVEVDFIIGKMFCAIEAKGTDRVRTDHLKGLEELKTEYPKVGRRIVVCLEKNARTTESGVEIMPYKKFSELLWSGELI